MKVRELIERLATCDPEADVVIGYEGVQTFTVGDVEAGWRGVATKGGFEPGGVERFRIALDRPAACREEIEAWTRTYTSARRVECVVLRMKE